MSSSCSAPKLLPWGVRADRAGHPPCSDVQHFPPGAEGCLGSSRRTEESQGAALVPVDAESTTPAEATGPPPALPEPLLSHAPAQPGAGPGFTSLSSRQVKSTASPKVKGIIAGHQTTDFCLSPEPGKELSFQRHAASGQVMST